VPSTTSERNVAETAPRPPPKDEGQTPSSAAPGLKTDMSDLTPLELHQMTQDLLDKSASDRPLIADSAPLSVLREEYERGSGSFVQQIDFLSTNKGFTHIRKTRGDGDCFYRSLAFAWISRLLYSSNQTLDVAKAISLLDSTLPTLEAAGFEKMVFEDFYDVIASLVRQIVVPEPAGTTLSSQVLLEAFQDAEVSNCIVVYLRFLTSATIKTDPDSYLPYIFDPETGDDISLLDFCQRHVEACGKEADNVQISALTKSLKINIEIAYLDGHSADGTVNFVSFQNLPETDVPNPPILLYRPGHYDILEKKA